MFVDSDQRGRLEVRDQDLITFRQGLVGLPDKRSFVMVAFAPGIPLGWLQCVDDPSFGIPVADPVYFRADYCAEASLDEADRIELTRPEDAAILVVTTIGPDARTLTANLKAPLVVNVERRLGIQVVLDQPDDDLRVPVDPTVWRTRVVTPPQRILARKPVST